MIHPVWIILKIHSAVLPVASDDGNGNGDNDNYDHDHDDDAINPCPIPSTTNCVY